MVEITPELVEKMKKLNGIHTSWKDYCLFLLNTASPDLRENWRKKFVTSQIHWSWGVGSIDESNIIGLEVMSSLPSEFTMKITDDAWDREEWYRDKRLPGSKRQVVCLRHYPQESLANEANMCMKAILNDWENLNYLIFQSDYITRMWEFAQKSNGNIITQDEILTYTLEKPTNEMIPAYFVDVADDIFTNGIDDYKYAKEYRSNKLKGYPFAEGSQLDFTNTKTGEKLTLDEMKANFEQLCNVILKESLSYSPSFKKICICVLKGDRSMQYAGFSPTLAERKSRAKAMAAFSVKEKERNNALKEMEKVDILQEKERKKAEKSNG